MNQPSSLYRRALGTPFGSLPRAVRAFHCLSGTFRMAGEATISGAETAVGRLLAASMHLPAPGEARPFTFVLATRPASETWSRQFGTRTLTTTISARGMTVTERFALVTLWYLVHCAPEALTMAVRKATLLGCRLPLAVVPCIRATEHGDGDLLQFDVDVRWPGTFRLIRYVGHLDLDSAERLA